MEDAILLKILEAQHEILAELRLLRQAVTAGQPLGAARQNRPQPRPAATAAPAAPAAPQAAPAAPQAAPTAPQAAAPRQGTPAQRQTAAAQAPAAPRPATAAVPRPAPAAQSPAAPPQPAATAFTAPPQPEPMRPAPPQPEPSLAPPVEAEPAPAPETFEEPTYATPEPRRQRSSSTLTLNELTDLGEQFLDPEQRSRPRVKPVDAADLSSSILDDIKAKNRAKRSAFAEFEKFSKDR